MEKPASPLKKLFAKQQPKVSATARKSQFLKTFADDDYKKIAILIQKWLEQDDLNRSKK